MSEIKNVPERKAYRTEWQGVVGIHAALSASKARYETYRAGRDVGYRIEIVDIRVKRAPEFDLWAATAPRRNGGFTLEYIEAEMRKLDAGGAGEVI